MGFRPLSDLSMLVQYGRFEPGDAYPADSRDASDREFVTAAQSFEPTAHHQVGEGAHGTFTDWQRAREASPEWPL